jgi:hypothetical protein
MLNLRVFCSLLLAAALAVSSAPAQPTTGAIKGVLTDDSGGVIPAASVSLAGNGGTKTAQTQADGSYAFNGLAPGQYTVQVTYPGFAPFQKAVTVNPGSTVQVPVQLAVSTEKQVVTVQAEGGPTVSVQPDNNATALVIKGEDLEALPDDPDDLSDALQALAGPAAGPNGGQIYIDGFSGGQLPPKESIREIRINQNPFSAEYDRLGFGRIEILTKPGSDTLRGALFLDEGNSVFNSRNPFSTNKPDYSNLMYGGNIGGPINKRASFFLDFNRRQVTGNALVNAIYLNPNTLVTSPLQQAVVTPNTRTTIAPRLDYQLSTNHTLVARFEDGWNNQNNNGIGGYRLPPPYAQTGYNSTGDYQNLMLTETAVVNASTINETRFQYTRTYAASVGNLLPTVYVSGAFTAGGADEGDNYDTKQHFELQNNTSISHGKHTIRWGVRIRRESDRNMSPNGFGGAYYFDGGIAPELDSNNQILLDANGNPVTEQILGIEQYRRTLLFQQLGFSPAMIQQYGGGATQFIIDVGNPYASVSQYDAAPWVQDDWRLRPNLTLSYGLRYEIQNNISDHRDFAPRLGVAWAPGSSKNGRQQTVIRGGFGIFYDRVPDTVVENTYLLNGTNQLAYTVTDPLTFPNVPPLSSLTPEQNSIYRLDPNLRSDYSLQSAIGVERQLPRNTTMALTYTNTRALHLEQTVPINTPLPGTYIQGEPGSGVLPYGNEGNLFEYESGGLMKQNLIMANFNTRFSKNVSLFGNYSYNRANALPTTPSDPYDFLLDWGRSPLERRHRFQLVGSVGAPLGLQLSPFVILQSGAPYDVELGRDLYGDTLKNARPAFATGPGPDVVVTPLGDFNSNPVPGSAANLVPYDYLTSAGLISFNLRVARTFGFGLPRGGNSMAAAGGNQGGMGGGGGRGGFGGGGGRGPGGGGGGMRMGGGGGRGGPFGMMGNTASSEHRYTLTFSVMFTNILNHVNPGGYVGALNSPQFGQPTGVNTAFGGGGFGTAGTTADNRRIQLQTRFTF